MSGRAELETLAKLDKYVFHGAPTRIEKLVPMQATTYDASQKIFINDGEPAVAATKFLDIAIFRALINKTNCPSNYRSGFGINDERLFFKATPEALESVRHSHVSGFVHVLDKNLFQPYSPKEVRSFQELTPIKIIEVTAEDLPENIEII